ncbi:MAG TPA: extracellular solute-binding protein [Candidatus Moranbacteria bacterium]|nr:extracellular solute-binding protein [Candidatus Moranbacteria bacterium]
MIKNKNKFIKTTVWLVVFSMIVPFFSGCSERSSNKYKIDLEIWGVFDDNSDFGEIVNAYREANPFINKIVYKKFPVDSYKSEIIDALASGNGPDIFLVNNAWMPYYEDKVAPAPNYILNEQSFRKNFVDVVADDFIGKSGEIYGAPLSVDSLALYYNKDLLNASGITSPPATWSELLDDSKKITKVNEFGDITHSGIALGTAYNINRSTDIIDLLMFQQGAQMPTKNEIRFKPDYNIGESVLAFYTQFARSSSPAYSWNKQMHYSIDAFYEGDLAMMINYSWHIKTIQNKNAKLNFAIAPIPQISKENPVNYANYWSFVVNKNKKIKQLNEKRPINNEVRIGEAWQFLKFLTFKNDGSFLTMNMKSKKVKKYPVSIDPADVYLKRTGKPAARRDLVEKQKTDPILGAFAYGNLIAKTWYKKDSNLIETIWAEIIDGINNGNITPSQAFQLVISRINQVNK